MGPLINAAAAERVESWVAEAVDAGATLLVGGKRNGTEYAPTLLADVPGSDAKVCSEEVSVSDGGVVVPGMSTRRSPR